MSETVLSQCSNFFIFKMQHPRDVSFIRQMVPFITDEIVERMKGLQRYVMKPLRVMDTFIILIIVMV